MLYETRRALLGFRLKLAFDESLNKDMSCIFVDVSKTATVGLLLDNIIERFQIPHNSFLTVQNCKVLPSESIYVLLDINSVKINGPSASTIKVRGTQPSNVSLEKNASHETNEVISCNEGDVVDGKSRAFLKPRPPKRHLREGIAATIKMLLEEEEIDRIGQECSGLSLSNDTSKIQSNCQQETMNVEDDEAGPNLHSEELTDLTSDACSDLNIEKKKRKRKRKHAKYQELENQPSSSSSFIEPVPKLRQSTNSTHGKHIRFDDADDEAQDTSIDENVISDTRTPSTNPRINEHPSLRQSSFLPHQQQQQLPPYQRQQLQQPLLQQSINDIQRHQQKRQLLEFQNLLTQKQQLLLQSNLLLGDSQQQLLQNQKMGSAQLESLVNQSSSSLPKSKYTQNTASSLTGTQPSFEQGQSDSSDGEIKQPKKNKNLLNGQPEDKETLNEPSLMETDDESSAKIRPRSKDQSSHKSTKNQLERSASTNATNLKFMNNYNQEESYHRPKSSLSPYNGRISNDKKKWSINSQTDSDNPVSSFINLPRLSESENKEYKPKHDRVEKELATLLMCKQLNTSMEYTVQFANEKGNSFPSTSPSSLKGVKNGNISQLAASQPNRSTKKFYASNLVSHNVKIEGNHENGLPERMEASSDDCEFLKQVKLDGTRIRLRKPDGTWTVLTPEIAATELPKLDVPKENQSIVFRIVYLNQNFIPTSSELLYGQIVSYQANTNKLAVDIPYQFVEAIAKDCEDEVLPETIVPITGSTFEVDLSTLVEPKVIS